MELNPRPRDRESDVLTVTPPSQLVSTALTTGVVFCTQLVPQECTRETSGLLYFDLLTSRMFRCTGQRWHEWGAWGSTGADGLQYTALLRDSAAADPPPAQPPADDTGTQQQQQDDDDDDDDDDVTPMTSGRQQAAGGRGRRRTCRQG